MNRPFRSYQPSQPQYRRNGKIRAREVRVLDETKKQLGVMSLSDAIRLATSRGFDLIEIAPDAAPPVCRMMEFGKFKYEESKRSKPSPHSGSKVKEVQLTPGIDPHDFSTKLNHAIDFLSHDLKVRVKLRFRGRQKAHKEVGFAIMNKFVADAAPYGSADSTPRMAGDRDLNVFLTPLPRDQRGKSSRAAKPGLTPSDCSVVPPSKPF